MLNAVFKRNNRYVVAASATNRATTTTAAASTLINERSDSFSRRQRLLPASPADIKNQQQYQQQQRQHYNGQQQDDDGYNVEAYSTAQQQNGNVVDRYAQISYARMPINLLQTTTTVPPVLFQQQTTATTTTSAVVVQKPPQSQQVVLPTILLETTPIIVQVQPQQQQRPSASTVVPAKQQPAKPNLLPVNNNNNKKPNSDEPIDTELKQPSSSSSSSMRDVNKKKLMPVLSNDTNHSSSSAVAGNNIDVETANGGTVIGEARIQRIRHATQNWMPEFPTLFRIIIYLLLFIPFYATLSIVYFIRTLSTWCARCCSPSSTGNARSGANDSSQQLNAAYDKTTKAVTIVPAVQQINEKAAPTPPELLRVNAFDAQWLVREPCFKRLQSTHHNHHLPSSSSPASTTAAGASVQTTSSSTANNANVCRQVAVVIVCLERNTLLPPLTSTSATTASTTASSSSSAFINSSPTTSFQAISHIINERIINVKQQQQTGVRSSHSHQQHLLFPRFSSTIVWNDREGKFAWQPVPSAYDTATHHIVQAPDNIRTMAGVRRHIANIMQVGLPADRPLWQIQYVPNVNVAAPIHTNNTNNSNELYYDDDTSAGKSFSESEPCAVLILSFSPALGDGVALVKLMCRYLMDPNTVCHMKCRFHSLTPMTYRNLGAVFYLPYFYTRNAWLRCFTPRCDINMIKHRQLRKTHRRSVLCSQPLSLAVLERIKLVTRCTLTEVILAIIAGTMRNYFCMRGVRRPRRCTIGLCVDLRSAEDDNCDQVPLENKFALVIVKLPLETEGIIPRLWKVRNTMSLLRDSTVTHTTAKVLGIGNATQSVESFAKSLSLQSERCTAYLSSVAGPDCQITINNSKVRAIHFWYPLSDLCDQQPPQQQQPLSALLNAPVDRRATMNKPRPQINADVESGKRPTQQADSNNFNGDSTMFIDAEGRATSISFGIMTYNNCVTLSIVADAVAVPQVEFMLTDFNNQVRELAQLLRYRRVPGEARHPPAQDAAAPVPVEQLQQRLRGIQEALRTTQANIDSFDENVDVRRREEAAQNVSRLRSELSEMLYLVRRRKSHVENVSYDDEDDFDTANRRRASSHQESRKSIVSLTSGRFPSSGAEHSRGSIQIDESSSRFRHSDDEEDF